MRNYGYMGSKESPQKRFRLYFKLSLIAIAVIVVFSLFYACQASKKQPLDLDDIDIIQYEVPDDDAPVVVFETSLGTFKSVLFPDEAPNFCEYFTDLVNDGYYDGTHVFMVEKGVYFMGGSKTDTGITDDETDETEINQELSKNLWPFRGALAAYGNESGWFFNKKIQSGSRILFVDTVEFTDDFIKELDSVDGNKDVLSTFKEKGGVPNFSQQYTIFGQVYDGMDVYEKICGYDVKDAEKDNLQPIDDITFKKVYMSTYGENKNDAAFTREEVKADSSVKDSSKAE